MITLDSFDALPPFEQIRTQITDQVNEGTLAAGDRLPTVRQLAAELGIATNTVARAYRELEQSGVVETRGRSGTYVTGDQTERMAKEAAVAYLERAAALGLSPANALALVQHQVDHPIRSS